MAYGYYSSGPNIQDLLLLGQVGANALSIPEQIDRQQQATATNRLLLARLGVPADQIDQYAPDPTLSLPGGTLGKILSGVGKVGTTLSAILGKPVPPPRVNVDTVAAVDAAVAKQNQRKNLEAAAGTFKNPTAANLVRGGAIDAGVKLEQGGSSGGTSESALLLRYQQATDPQEKAQLRAALDELNSRKTGRAISQAQAMAPILEQRTQTAADIASQKAIKTEAAKKYNQIFNVYNTVMPLMQQAKSALTSSPLIAGSGLQRPYLWAKALLGDKAAAAVRNLPSQAAQLARTQDTGNLNEQEQKVWYSFINGEDMTAQQFGVAIDLLDGLLKKSAAAAKHTYDTGELAPMEDLKPFPADTPGSPPLSGKTKTGKDWEVLH